jgi:plastocyanin
VGGSAWTRQEGTSDAGELAARIDGFPLPGLRTFGLALAAVAAALMLFASSNAQAADCPPIKNKPDQIPHVSYPGVRHLSFCYGPITIKPGQNIIRLHQSDLFPKAPGYITRFDPDLVYASGKVPRVDVLHLHHAVWAVNGAPQFATGEEKSIVQTPQGFGWRSKPSDTWFVNDMIHDLVGQAAKVYIVWRVDFVPDTSPAAATMHQVRTRWMDVSGPSPRVGISSPIYPVFNALHGMGKNGKYTFPDQATPSQKAFRGPSQTWTPDHPVTLIDTVGHLHPGGLKTSLTVSRGSKRKTVFDSKAHYYEPAGEVSWDVAMGATPNNWRVKMQPGDTLGVHATYDVSKASWYEVMGIMPVAVYDGTNVGGVDAINGQIPTRQVLTHTHLDENRNHGGTSTGLPDPRFLKGDATPPNPIGIQDYNYLQGDLAGGGGHAKPPEVQAGQSLTFKNLDASQSVNTFHTLTACKAPCNRSTGIAYPIANGSTTFDSGQLGYNYAGFNAPAADRDTWKTPKNLKPGTYTYFCRVHPFMRGSFRVIDR